MTPSLHALCCSRTAVALEKVRSELGKGADARKKDVDGLTPLHIAATCDNLAVCQLLLHFGADILVKDSLGRTPFDVSTGNTRIFFTKMLERDKRTRRNLLRRLFMCHAGSPSPTPKSSTSISAKSNFRRSLNKILRRPSQTSEGKQNISITRLYPVLPESAIVKLSGRRARTPDGLNTPKREIATLRRSKTPDFDPCRRGEFEEPDTPRRSIKKGSQPRTLRSRQAVVPSAPPLSPVVESAKPNTHRRNNSRHDVDSHPSGSLYLTADDESFEMPQLEERLKQIQISSEVKTPTKDDEKMSQIKRLKDSQLRDELRKHGVFPGPMCSRTRKLYEKKLYVASSGENLSRGITYSKQLELAFKGIFNEKNGKDLDASVKGLFANSGVTAFVYLLLDPRILGDSDAFSLKQFVAAIFYVGKGTKARPLAHLIDAKRMHDSKSPKKALSEKLKKIDCIWKSGRGIVLLEISHTISDHEAFVREAALFEAIKIENLTNIKGGEWHGSTKAWTPSMKAELGVFQLKQAMIVTKVLGARQVFPDSLPEPFVTMRKK